MSVAGSGDVVVTSVDAMSRDAMRCHGDELLYVSSYCSRMECYQLCEATLCGSKWFCDDVVIQRAILY